MPRRAKERDVVRREPRFLAHDGGFVSFSTRLEVHECRLLREVLRLGPHCGGFVGHDSMRGVRGGGYAFAQSALVAIKSVLVRVESATGETEAELEVYTSALVGCRPALVPETSAIETDDSAFVRSEPASVLWNVVYGRPESAIAQDAGGTIAHPPALLSTAGRGVASRPANELHRADFVGSRSAFVGAKLVVLANEPARVAKNLYVDAKQPAIVGSGAAVVDDRRRLLRFEGALVVRSPRVVPHTAWIDARMRCIVAAMDVDQAIGTRVEALKARLGANLYSCILYGSAVRGNIVPGVSDVNLLLVLNESTPEAHGVIAELIRGAVPISPFILGRRGLERSFRAFSVKFRSIQRNYRVLHGADPLAELSVPESIVRAECEQVLRNLRLRVVHAFVTFGSNDKRYSSYLVDITADLFVALSEPLRLEVIEVPPDLAGRLPALEKTYAVDTTVLRDLLALKGRPRVLSSREAATFHDRLFRLLDKAVTWIETRWPV